MEEEILQLAKLLSSNKGNCATEVKEVFEDDTVLDYLSSSVDACDNFEEFLEILSSFFPSWNTDICLSDGEQIFGRIQKLVRNPLDEQETKETASPKTYTQQASLSRKNDPIYQILDICPQFKEYEETVKIIHQKHCSNKIQSTVEFLLNNGIEGVKKIREKELKKVQQKQNTNFVPERISGETVISGKLKYKTEIKESEKKKILSRFDEYVENSGVKKNNKAGRKANKRYQNMLLKKSTKEDDKIRYLDGQVVSRKGERFIVVDDKPEWDGGSRGRVKTKGKRGPGFVAG